MEKQLKEMLVAYKNHTIELIMCLEKEEYDSIESFLNKRQQILDELSNLNYPKEELSKEAEELELSIYQEKLNDLMIEKREKIKQEIKRLALSKNASNLYNKNDYRAKIFSKKI